MKIYTIRHNEAGHAYYTEHVIAANNINEVRELAKWFSLNEGESVWNDAKIKEIGNYSGTNMKPFIILSSMSTI